MSIRRLTIVVACAVLANFSLPTHAQEAYYSFVGTSAGGPDVYDFTFFAGGAPSSSEILEFRTYGFAGGTNAAGDVIPGPMNFDPVLRLYHNGTDVLEGADDDGGTLLDSLLSWTSADSLALNPDPLPVAYHRIELSEFSSQAGDWALDIVSSEDEIDLGGVFVNANATASPTITSLKFGSNNEANARFFNDAGISITDTLEVGSGLTNPVLKTTLYQQGGGTTTIGSQFTVNADGLANIDGGTFNIGGDTTIDGGTFNLNAGFISTQANTLVDVMNAGQYNFIAGSYSTGTDQVVNLSNGGVFSNQGTAGDNTIRVDATDNWDVDITTNGELTGDYLFFYDGEITADQGNVIFQSGVEAGFTHRLGDPNGAGDADIRLSNGSVGSFDSIAPTTLFMGGNTAEFIIESSSTAILQSLEIANASFFSALTVTGPGSSVDQNNAPNSFTTTVGAATGGDGIINVDNQSIYDSGQGAFTINPTGQVNVNNGTMDINGAAALEGGELNHNGGTLNLNAGLTINAGDFNSTSLFSSSTTTATTINVVSGNFNLDDGDVTTGSFSQGGGTTNLRNGSLTINGGTFGLPGGIFNLDGASAPDNPTLIFDSGATTPVALPELKIGDVKEASIVIQGGSVVSSLTADLGSQATGIGHATVQGLGSTWNIVSDHDLAVGEAGTGTLNVLDSAYFHAVDDLPVGRDPNSNGTLNVDDATVDVDYWLVLGENGTGNATFTNNAVVNVTEDTIIGWVGGSSGSLTVDTGATLNANDNLTVGGHIASSGGTGIVDLFGGDINVADSLIIHSTGTVNLTGGHLTADIIDHTNGGVFNFNGGTLTVLTFDGDLTQNGGTLAPGASPGVTNVTGSYDLNAGALAIELGGTGGVPATDFDQITVSGTLGLGGTLDVTLVDIGGGVLNPQAGDFFDILNFGSISGDFTTMNLPAIDLGLMWNVGFLKTTGELLSTIMGDINGDLTVGVTDLGLLANQWGTGGFGQFTADITGDGIVSVTDLGALAANWGDTVGPSLSSAAVVPIPSAGFAGGVLLIGIGLRRARRG